MGCKPSSHKKIIMKGPGAFNRRLALQEPENFNISDFDGILSLDSLHRHETPPATPRAPSYKYMEFQPISKTPLPKEAAKQLRFEQQPKETQGATRLNYLNKIDVNLNHRKIKPIVQLKLDLTKIAQVSATSPQSTCITPMLSNRSNRVVEDFKVDPFDHSEPLERFQVERFDKRKSATDRASPRLSKMKVFKSPRQTPDLIESSRKSTTITTFSDLLTEVKKRQLGSITPIVKEAIASRRAIADNGTPKTPHSSLSWGMLKPSTIKYRVKNIKSEVFATKSTSELQTTIGLESKRTSKAEKQWQWRGAFGKLKQRTVPVNYNRLL